MSDFEKGAEAAAERDRLRDALHDLRKQSQRFIRETLLLCDGLDADYLKANPQLLYCTLLLRELARGKIPAPPAGESREAVLERAMMRLVPFVETSAELLADEAEPDELEEARAAVAEARALAAKGGG